MPPNNEHWEPIRDSRHHADEEAMNLAHNPDYVFTGKRADVPESEDFMTFGNKESDDGEVNRSL